MHFFFCCLLKTQKLINFFIISRSDTSHSHLRSRHPPLGDDGHMDDGGGDDDLQALLPASRGLSREDLSQVILKFNSYASLIHKSFVLSFEEEMNKIAVEMS